MTEVSDLALLVQNWSADRRGYELSVLAEAGLSAAHMVVPTPLEKVIYAPLYCLVLQGRKTVQFDGKIIAFEPGHGVIISHYLPVAGRIEKASARAPYLALALRVDLDLLRSLGAETGLAPGREPANAIRAAAADAPTLDAMKRLFALAEEGSAARVLAPLVVRELHFRLLQSAHGGMLRRLALSDSHASRIARAIAHIRLHFAAPLTVAGLADVAGMSVSSFHEHFRAITGMTPLQFQKQLRLTEARRLLLARSHNVGSAARMVGYESPTQFSREYSRAFGLSPRRDAAA